MQVRPVRGSQGCGRTEICREAVWLNRYSSARCGYATGMPAPEDAAVPPLVRKSAAWSWRLLLIFVAVLAVLVGVQAARSDPRAGGAGVDVLCAADAGRGLAGPARRAPRRCGVLAVAAGVGAGRGNPDFRRQPVHPGPARISSTRSRHSIDKATNWLITRPGASEPAADRQRGQVGDRRAAEQSGEADHRRAVHRKHHHRDHHRCVRRALHADLLPLRRPQHLRVRHADLPGRTCGRRFARRAGPASDR